MTILLPGTAVTRDYRGADGDWGSGDDGTGAEERTETGAQGMTARGPLSQVGNVWELKEYLLTAKVHWRLTM